MDKENRMWFQQAKVLWALNGDKNSKIFHCRATERKRKNSILKIRDTSGQWRTNPNEVNHCLVEYFQKLFTSTNNLNPHEAVNSINTIISEDMRSQLSATFTTGEVQIALKQLTPLKAPGLDGMPPLFYQNFWNLTGNDVTESVLKFLNFASLPE